MNYQYETLSGASLPDDRDKTPPKSTITSHSGERHRARHHAEFFVPNLGFYPIVISGSFARLNLSTCDSV